MVSYVASLRGEATVIVGKGLPPLPALPGPGSVPPYPDGSRGLTQTSVASPFTVESYRQAAHLSQNTPVSWQERPREAKRTPTQGPSSAPRESPSTGLEEDSTLSNQGITPNPATMAHVKPTIASPSRMDQLPLTRLDNAAALPTK